VSLGASQTPETAPSLLRRFFLLFGATPYRHWEMMHLRMCLWSLFIGYLGWRFTWWTPERWGLILFFLEMICIILLLRVQRPRVRGGGRYRIGANRGGDNTHFWLPNRLANSFSFSSDGPKLRGRRPTNNLLKNWPNLDKNATPFTFLSNHIEAQPLTLRATPSGDPSAGPFGRRTVCHHHLLGHGQFPPNSLNYAMGAFALLQERQEQAAVLF
jgi:hypothetical protein